LPAIHLISFDVLTARTTLVSSCDALPSAAGNADRNALRRK
jgi:hypothetical protein